MQKGFGEINPEKSEYTGILCNHTQCPFMRFMEAAVGNQISREEKQIKQIFYVCGNSCGNKHSQQTKIMECLYRFMQMSLMKADI